MYIPILKIQTEYGYFLKELGNILMKQTSMEANSSSFYQSWIKYNADAWKKKKEATWQDGVAIHAAASCDNAKFRLRRTHGANRVNVTGKEPAAIVNSEF